MLRTRWPIVAARSTNSGRRGGRPSPDARILGAVALLLAALWTAIGSYVVHSYFPANVIELPGEAVARRDLPYVVPEGWAFFTRDAREERILLFRRAVDGWHPANLGPHAEARNIFGLDRASRAQGVELALLISGVGAEDWTSCEMAPIDCVAHAAFARSVDNVSPRPSLCGDVGVALQEPVPWVWASAGGSVTMPSRVIRLSVAC
jgi:sporulation delaying protein A